MDISERSNGSEIRKVNHPTHAQAPEFSHLAVVTFHSKWHPDRACTVQSGDDLAWEVAEYLCSELPSASTAVTCKKYRVRNYGPAAGKNEEQP